MDINQAIDQLRAEKDRIERVIAQMEQLFPTPRRFGRITATGKRRGRTSMGAEERKQVSARLKEYWAQRREGRFRNEHGQIVMCSGCKRTALRNGESELWKRVTYFIKHTPKFVTHGLCEQCLSSYYREPPAGQQISK
jgi:hypothetical protein